MCLLEGSQFNPLWDPGFGDWTACAGGCGGWTDAVLWEEEEGASVGFGMRLQVSRRSFWHNLLYSLALIMTEIK